MSFHTQGKQKKLSPVSLVLQRQVWWNMPSTWKSYAYRQKQHQSFQKSAHTPFTVILLAQLLAKKLQQWQECQPGKDLVNTPFSFLKISASNLDAECSWLSVKLPLLFLDMEGYVLACFFLSNSLFLSPSLTCQLLLRSFHFSFCPSSCLLFHPQLSHLPSRFIPFLRDYLEVCLCRANSISVIKPQPHSISVISICRSEVSANKR